MFVKKIVKSATTKWKLFLVYFKLMYTIVTKTHNHLISRQRPVMPVVS